MRIIAGRLGGRHFASPHGHRTHPMSDKIRGALFNALGNIDDLTVLDAFAGSGALGFEAISRGAAQATLLDNDRNAQRAIADNIQELDLEGQVKLVKASASAWLSTTHDLFDIVLLDPPYQGLQPALLEQLAQRVKPDGLVVCSLPPGQVWQLAEPYELISEKNYGDAELRFYRRAS